MKNITRWQPARWNKRSRRKTCSNNYNLARTKTSILLRTCMSVSAKWRGKR